MNLYLVENRATRKRYVAATTAKLIVYRHRLVTDARRHPGQPGSLLADIALHGIGVILIILIEVCDDNHWRARRQFFVRYFGTEHPNGYNWPGGDKEVE